MPGSTTTPGRPDARAGASEHVAFRYTDNDGDQFGSVGCCPNSPENAASTVTMETSGGVKERETAIMSVLLRLESPQG